MYGPRAGPSHKCAVPSLPSMLYRMVGMWTIPHRTIAHRTIAYRSIAHTLRAVIANFQLARNYKSIQLNWSRLQLANAYCTVHIKKTYQGN